MQPHGRKVCHPFDLTTCCETLESLQIASSSAVSRLNHRPIVVLSIGCRSQTIGRPQPKPST